MIDKAEQGEDITIYGTHNPLRNYIHADDVAHSINEVIKQKIEGIFPCLYPKDTSFIEIAETAYSVFNLGGEVLFLKEKDNIPDNIFEKDMSLYKIINRLPQIDLKTGIKRIKKFKSKI
jgi:nucleoside-diphosphate-sugar epimerase